MDPVSQAALLEAAKVGGPVALVLVAFLYLLLTERVVPGRRLEQERADWHAERAQLREERDAALGELRLQAAVNQRVLDRRRRR